LNIIQDSNDATRHIARQIFTGFSALILLLTNTNTKIAIEKTAIIIGSQLPYPIGVKLKYEKCNVRCSPGSSANVIATPYGKAIKIKAISMPTVEAAFLMAILLKTQRLVSFKTIISK
jgi:SH3-like domain-containing protein